MGGHVSQMLKKLLYVVEKQIIEKKNWQQEVLLK